MGINQSKDAKLENEWEPIQQGNLFSIPGRPSLVHQKNKPSMIGQRYQYIFADTNKKKQAQIFNNRKSVHKNVVGIYDYEVTKDFMGCVDNSNRFDIITQRIFSRLKDHRNISLAEVVYILNESSSGYETLAKYNRICYPSDDMIGIKQNGEIKIWSNKSWADNSFTEARSQQASVQQLWTAVRQHSNMNQIINLQADLKNNAPFTFNKLQVFIERFYSGLLNQGRFSLTQRINKRKNNFIYPSPVAQQRAFSQGSRKAVIQPHLQQPRSIYNYHTNSQTPRYQHFQQTPINKIDSQSFQPLSNRTPIQKPASVQVSSTQQHSPHVNFIYKQMEDRSRLFEDRRIYDSQIRVDKYQKQKSRSFITRGYSQQRNNILNHQQQPNFSLKPKNQIPIYGSSPVKSPFAQAAQKKHPIVSFDSHNPFQSKQLTGPIPVNTHPIHFTYNRFHKFQNNRQHNVDLSVNNNKPNSVYSAPINISKQQQAPKQNQDKHNYPVNVKFSHTNVYSISHEPSIQPFELGIKLENAIAKRKNQGYEPPRTVRQSQKYERPTDYYTQRLTQHSQNHYIRELESLQLADKYSSPKKSNDIEDKNQSASDSKQAAEEFKFYLRSAEVENAQDDQYDEFYNENQAPIPVTLPKILQAEQSNSRCIIERWDEQQSFSHS